jgi:hypothetical protein
MVAALVGCAMIGGAGAANANEVEYTGYAQRESGTVLTDAIVSVSTVEQRTTTPSGCQEVAGEGNGVNPSLVHLETPIFQNGRHSELDSESQTSANSNNVILNSIQNPFDVNGQIMSVAQNNEKATLANLSQQSTLNPSLSVRGQNFLANANELRNLGEGKSGNYANLAIEGVNPITNQNNVILVYVK